LNELIKIEVKEGQETVNARELHSFMEVRTRFNDWFKLRVEKYGFTEGEDFTAVTEKLVTVATEYFISIDMAKELSMVENNDKGREARRWFIAREKQAVEMTNDPFIALRLKQIAAEKRLSVIEEHVNLLIPAPGFYTVTGYANRTKVRIDSPTAQRLGVKVSKICRDRGVTPGTVPDAKWGNVNAYPEDILREVFNDASTNSR